MDAEQQKNAEAPKDEGVASDASGDQLISELDRLGRKFVEVLNTAWNSDQRRQIEQDLRKGLNSVAESLESGLKELSEKEQTKEFIGKAESVADDVGEKVRNSGTANDLARGLASGLHILADQLDRLARDMRRAESGDAVSDSSAQPDAGEGQDIPISEEPKSNPPA